MVEADENIKFNFIYDNGQTTFTTYNQGINEFCFKICSKQAKLEITSDSTNMSVKKVVLDYYEYWYKFIKKIKYLSPIFILYFQQRYAHNNQHARK